MGPFIFIILNVFISVVLVTLSFAIDSDANVRSSSKRRVVSKEANSTVNLILFLSSLFALMAVTIALCIWAPRQLSLLVGRITFMLMGWFSVNCCYYMLTYPTGEKSKVLTALQWIFYVLAAYLVFRKNGLNSINVDYNSNFVISSGLVFSGVFGRRASITWFPLFMAIYLQLLPLITMLMVLVKAENAKTKLEAQGQVLLALGVVSSWAIFKFIDFAIPYQPMIRSLQFLGFLPQMLIFMNAQEKKEIWDRRRVFRSAVKFLLIYMLPAAIDGILYTILWKLFSNNRIIFYIIFVLITIVMVFTWIFLGRAATKTDIMRDSRYASDFENEITSIDFQDDPKDIIEHFSATFKRFVDVDDVHIVVDSGDGYLESAFTEEENKINMPITNEAFDFLLNLKHPIVFKEFAKNDYSIATVRSQILQIFEDTASDAFIILNEGRHIVSIIFLGKKRSGNIFNDYDYDVFNKLYSNFFVIGYYMKNILNEAVVGTVNKEINMSGQIINSIQENMDKIENPKVDCGYVMIPAHNIGGEFVDLIRLNEQRHIFIIGAMSGRGIAASMNMVILKSIIRTFLAETTDFKELVAKVNAFIRTSMSRGTFFEGIFGLLDFATDTMYYINCGSPALFMYTRAYNNVIEIQGEGHILGFVKDIHPFIRVKKVKLSEGDIIMSCTNGLIETTSLRGELYGKERVQAQIMENSSYPAEKMARFAYDALVQFTSKALENDVTIITLKYKGNS